MKLLLLKCMYLSSYDRKYSIRSSNSITLISSQHQIIRVFVYLIMIILEMLLQNLSLLLNINYLEVQLSSLHNYLFGKWWAFSKWSTTRIGYNLTISNTILISGSVTASTTFTTPTVNYTYEIVTGGACVLVQ